MRLTANRNASGTTYYIIRSIVREGKRSSEVVERLGNEKEIMEKYHCNDAAAWAKARLEQLNAQEKEKVHKVLMPYRTDSLIPVDRQNSFQVGYLFLQKLYCALKIPSICKTIAARNDFQYDLDAILSRLVYERILHPSSKRSCWEQSKELLEPPRFALHQVYRALSVLAKESDFIQAQMYENSKKLVQRKTGVLYYDCTNYFFESEVVEGLRQFGPSKEHRPNPIVQMGLFMDKSGIPLAFCIHEGNRSEQQTLTPLEKQLMRDFSLSQFVVCTDAGLASEANRRFNNFGGRAFITTQSIKKLKGTLKNWCLEPTGWRLKGSEAVYDLRELEENDEMLSKVFYKERFLEGYDEARDISFNHTLIVTYSQKYRNYQRRIRQQQVDRAAKAMARDPRGMERRGLNDFRRFVKKTAVTPEGEIASGRRYALDSDAIAEEARYDGFYAVCTNLEDDAADIAQINRGRWEIEESFRILKTEFEARPVYLARNDRIKAHFLTCFLSLLIYRLLEHRLGQGFSCEEILHTLRGMRVTEAGKEGYIPSYTRTTLTNALHDLAGFRTDFELISQRSMQGICRKSKA